MLDKLWITETEAQEYLGCKRGKLWQLRNKGLIEWTKSGRSTLYHKPSIDDYLLGNSTLRND